MYLSILIDPSRTTSCNRWDSFPATDEISLEIQLDLKTAQRWCWTSRMIAMITKNILVIVNYNDIVNIYNDNSYIVINLNIGNTLLW